MSVAGKELFMAALFKSREYKAWLKGIKDKLRRSQLKAAVSVNSSLLQFYWELGAEIVKTQKSAAWGSGFLKQLSKDLMAAFPQMKGFSKRNLEQIRRWYRFYSVHFCGCNAENPIAKQAASQMKLCIFKVPWWHNVTILTKCKDVHEALFYVAKTIEHNWSRSVLVHQIESGLFHRKGKAINNFDVALVEPQSDLAHQILKDPYCFDFLELSEGHSERELENGLIENLRKFFLEIGSGFALLGQQVPIRVGSREFYLDLLFYHAKLHCYVVVELKTTDFEPEYIGKLNFYVKAVDEKYRSDGDNKTIGLLLCKTKDKLVAEYSLSDMNKPLGVSEYGINQSLPESLKSKLPSVEALRSGLESDGGRSDE